MRSYRPAVTFEKVTIALFVQLVLAGSALGFHLSDQGVFDARLDRCRALTCVFFTSDSICSCVHAYITT